jgi:outer membrane protein assembly factor BamE (lipoprotein component of BamABCDE complex)
MMKMNVRLLTAMACVIALSGCAQVAHLTEGSQTDQEQKSAGVKTQEAAPAASSTAKDKPAAQGSYTEATEAESKRGIYGNPPRHSPFAKLKLGMSSKQVTDLIGEPTDQKSYMTGKIWIPFYFGSDRARLEYRYKGQGVLTFVGGGGFVSSNFTLYRVIYNPKEEGYEH